MMKCIGEYFPVHLYIQGKEYFNIKMFARHFYDHLCVKNDHLWKKCR